jgi:hypothetical protein
MPEIVVMSIVCFVVGMGIFKILISKPFKYWKKEIIGYIMLLFIGSICWISLFTAGQTGVTGNINFIIFGSGMIIIHLIVQSLNNDDE